MNHFNRLLLSTTALTLVALGRANAAPVTFIETTDFALSSLGVPTSLSLAVASGSSSGVFQGVEVFGTVGGLVSGPSSSGGTSTYDDFDVFSISGLTPGQFLNIQLVPAATSSGGEPDPGGGAASGGGSLSGFALNLMEYTTGSGGAASSGSSTPTLTQIGASIFQASFDFHAFVPAAGELVFQIENGATSAQDYRLMLSVAESEVAVPEAGSAAGLAAGAAGLGFVAARRRRRKK